MKAGAVPPAQMLEQAQALLQQAEACRIAGDHAQGVQAATRALELATTLRRKGLRGQALSLLAINELRLGEAEAAIRHGLQALPLMRRQQDLAPRVQLLCMLVMAYNDLGFHSDALTHVLRAVESARASGDLSLISWAYNRAGLTYDALGNTERGRSFLEEALSFARQLIAADTDSEGRGQEEAFSALNNLCDLYLRAAVAEPDDTAREPLLDQAMAYGSEGLVLAEASGNAHRRGVCLNNLAMTLTWLNRHDEALRHIEVEERLALEKGYRAMHLMARVSRAVIERRSGRILEAIAIYEDALAQASRYSESADVRSLHEALYQCHKQAGHFEPALRHHEAMAELERGQMRQRVDMQARLFMNRLELEHAQFAADRARLDADLQRLRAERLELENKQLEVQALELGRHAMEDQLTGLANRRRMDQDLPIHLASAKDRRLPLSVASIDLDHFKQVNDRFGHNIGDDVLRAVAQILLAQARSSDLLARMGGEEFLVVLAATPLASAIEVCERLRAAIQSHDWQALSPGLQVTASIGLCEAAGSLDVRALLGRVDEALYQAKHSGRNRLQVSRLAAP